MSFASIPYAPFGPPTPFVPGLPDSSVQPPFQPPTGYQPFNEVPVGLGICPTGTRCVGPSIETRIGSLCLGTCSPYDITSPDPQSPPSSCADPNFIAACAAGRAPPGTSLSTLQTACATCGVPFGTSFDPTRPDTPTTPTTPQTAGQCGCARPGAKVKCQLNGKCGQLNQSRYYQFGDCRTGTRAGVVEKGTKCVPVRKMNMSNPEAAKRAIKRLSGHHALLQRTEKVLKKYATRATRRRR